MRVLFTIIFMVLAVQSSSGQNFFTLDDAIRAALVHNHGVIISDIESDIAENSVTRGNAGQLPTLAITGGLSASYEDLEIQPGSFFQNLLGPQGSVQQSSRPSISYDGVTTTQMNAQLGSQIVVFNGLKGRLRYKTLKKGGEIAELLYRAEVENTILNITSLYIRVASLQRAIQVRNVSLQQSADRYRTAETRREYGQVNEQQLLQAIADLKSDSTALRNMELQFENAYRDLHTEIGWDRRKMNPVDVTVEETPIPEYEELKSMMKRNNTLLNIREKRLEQAELSERISEAGFMPTLTASAGYGYSYLNASEGQFETQEQMGLNGGLTLRVPIFSGWQNRIETENAALHIRREELRKEESSMQLQTRFENAWKQYQFYREQLRTERSNLIVYERNFERAEEMFAGGEITGLKLREAQLSLENAELRVAEAGFKLKQNRVLLFYLSGVLVMDYPY